MKNDQQGKKVALVTGGSRGIGLGIAHALAKAGFDLAINGVRDERLVAKQLATLRSEGAQVEYCQGNISDFLSRKSIVNKVRERYGKLTVLVNNAGVAPRERGDILEATEESFDHVIGVNLKGTYFLTQEAANWMIEQKNTESSFDGCIINITSVSATMASVNRGDYCISKAGMSMVTKLFAARLGEFGISVFEIRPGIIATDMTAGVKEKYDKLFEEGLAIESRWGTAEDIGRAAAALARGDFPYATGQVVISDGGMNVPRL
jgi:3-oxoacyl-[acyl-carrier protein] reductase